MSELVADGLFELSPPRLLGARCVECDRASFPRETRCPHCRSTDLKPLPLSTTGTVFSYTIVRVPVPGYTGPVPYGLGVVELPDGIRVNSTLVAEPLEALRIGVPVRARLVDVGTAQAPLLSYAFEMAAP
jgi:uncharacterized OB-fold protein